MEAQQRTELQDKAFDLQEYKRNLNLRIDKRIAELQEQIRLNRTEADREARLKRLEEEGLSDFSD